MNDFQIQQLFLKDYDRRVINGMYAPKKWAIEYKFGENVETGITFEDTAPFEWTQLTSASTLNISSDNANDTNGGTGARTIKIIGLDGNYNEIEETVTMNGTATVTTSKSFIIVHRAFPVLSGSNETNIGTITMTATTGGSTQAVISAINHTTIQAFSIIPAGYHAVLVNWEVNAGKADDFQVQILVKNINESWRELKALAIFESNIMYQFGGAVVLQEKTAIKVRGKTLAGNRPLLTGYSYLLIEN